MISAVILTKNEEKNIAPCMESLSWCDEILVIDDNSDDKTVEIARKHGAKVFIHAINHDFSIQRNYALTKAKGDWIIFIDADERVSSPLWYEIMQHTSESIGDISGFYVKRQDTMWGRILRHGETGQIKLLRIAKKGAGNWEGRVHEVWKINGRTILLQNHLDHYPHGTVESFLKEINYYTDLRAQELYERNAIAYWWSPIFYPFAKFILNYIFRRGFMDGIAGLIFAIHMSFHSFLVRSKLWLLWQKK